MAGYRQLISEKRWLRVQARARALMGTGTDLLAILYKDRRLIFKTASGTYGKRVIWTQTVELTDATLQNILAAKSFKDIETLIRESDLKIHCNCIAHGTRILTKEGFKEIQDIEKGDYVLGSDSKWHEVHDLLKSEVKSNWVSINIRGMRDPLVVSTDHKLLFSTYRDVCACGCGKQLRASSEGTRMNQAYQLYDRRMYIPKHSKRPIADGFERYQLHTVSEFKPGELLCSPLVKGSIEFDVDYARMLGYYLAEGHIPASGSTVVITLNQNEEFTIAKDIVDYFTSKKVKAIVRKCEYGGNKWLTVSVYSKDFRKDCEYYCGKGSTTKNPHTDILEWSDDAKAAFVIGHLLGDGAVDDSFRWLSTSKDLVDMLQLIINSLGVHTSSYVANYNKARATSHICYAVSTTINQFYPYYEQYKSLFRNKDLISKNASRGQNDVHDYVLYKVTAICPVEPQYGYDIVLSDEPHTYLANNVIVSNCPAFLYWGYKYMAWKRGYGLERETRKPRVRNPHERGFLCKHLQLVLTLYPFWAPALAKKFKNWAGYKEGASATGISNFQAPRMNRGNKKFVNQLSNPNTGVNQPASVNDSNSTTQINQTSQVSSLN